MGTFNQIAIGTLCLGLFTFSWFTLLPTLARAYFNASELRIVLPHIQLGFIPAAMFPIAAGYEHDQSNTYISSYVFSVFCFVSVVGVFMWFRVPKTPPTTTVLARVLAKQQQSNNAVVPRTEK